MNKKFLVCCIMLLFLAVSFTGCTENEVISSDNVQGELIPLSIVSFKIIPSEIKIGETVNLSWNVIGALSVEIDNGIGNVSLFGRRIITPNQTTNYTLIARNSTKTLSKKIQIIVTEYNGLDEKNESNGDNETDVYIWYFVRRFSGSGRTTTDVFNISSDVKWKVKWLISGETPDYIPNETTSRPSPYFDFRVMKANTLFSVAYARSEEWSDSGIVEINITNSQSYYLDVNLRHIDSWTIDVYEWKILNI